MDGSGAPPARRFASAAFLRHISARGDGMARLLNRTEQAIHCRILPTCCRFDSFSRTPSATTAPCVIRDVASCCRVVCRAAQRRAYAAPFQVVHDLAQACLDIMSRVD